MSQILVVNCRDGCGTFEPFAPEVSAEEASDALLAIGWLFLASVSRWRCPACKDRLDNVIAASVNDPDFADKLDPRSRGALPRNTAVTILPPANVAEQDNSTLVWE